MLGGWLSGVSWPRCLIISQGEFKQVSCSKMRLVASGTTVQLEGNLTKTCGWQAKEMWVNLVRVPQIRAGARKGKYPDIRHLVIKMSYYSPICS